MFERVLELKEAPRRVREREMHVENPDWRFKSRHGKISPNAGPIFDLRKAKRTHEADEKASTQRQLISIIREAEVPLVHYLMARSDNYVIALDLVCENTIDIGAI
jgi:hypothetical protein